MQLGEELAGEELARICPKFIHLRVHSAFSLLEGALKSDKIIAQAVADTMPAIAITDTNNLFGALEFSQKAIKAGVQPIIGCQLSVDFSDDKSSPHKEGIAGDFPSLVLLAASDEGHENLVTLVSRAWLEKAPQEPAHVKADDLNLFGEGIIALTGGAKGAVDDLLAAGKIEAARVRLEFLTRIFGDRLYVELQRHGAYDKAREADLLRLAYEQNLPLVATNEAFFLTKADYEAHDALLAIAEGQVISNDDRRRVTPDHYLKNQAEMVALFADLPEALENSVEIALRCHAITPKRSPILPRFTGGGDDPKAALEHFPKSVKRFSDKKCGENKKLERSTEPSEVKIALERFPKSVERFSDKKRGENKKLEHSTSPSEVKNALAAEAEELARQAREGLKMRLKTIGAATGYVPQDYEKRLDYEIDIITKMQFPGYFLIVADFIKWAKAQGIPVGPGRGSGAGSLVAYALTITDIDPLRFSLLFERFLNPDRVSMPDFDIDFCQDRREEVIRYVQEKYGRAQVAQIITFGTLQARAVLRDVGRVLEMPYSQVDRLSKLVPSNPANPISLAQAVKDEPKFGEEEKKEPVVGRLLDIAKRLEGLYRHASTHAAGVVIGDRPLWQLVPMYSDPRSDMPVTQFSMKYVEEAGLVKFDFLGLKTLTVMETAVKLIARKGINLDLTQMPLDDGETYQMMARGETVGVFQVESAGMRKALIGMKPDRIEDIIALVALYRPGPMENIPVYNARKHGEEEIASIHPKIDHLVAETQGVIVYQEQVMQIAQELSGYSLGEADLLRRAMGKKIRAEMDKQRSRFVEGAMAGGVDKNQAHVIFDLLAKFADYGFNKSHAAAYAMISYQTAYLKAHYPVEFLAASMTYDMSNTDKLNDFRREAMRLGITVVAPSIQTSHAFFEVGEGCIYYALAAIKGVGEQAAFHIAERRGVQKYADLEDFCQRTDPHIINRRALESLINAGAFDCFGLPRERMIAGMDAILARASRLRDDQNSGQFDIFALDNGPKDALILPESVAWLPAEKLQREFQVIGFYLSAHPLDDYQQYLDKMRVQNWATFLQAVRRGATAGRLAGTVNAKQIRKTRSGGKMGIVQLSDTTGQYEAILFSETLGLYGDLLEAGQSVIITVVAEDRPEGISLRIETVRSLEDAALAMRGTMRLYINSSRAAKQIASVLEKQTGGEGEVSLILVQDTVTDGGMNGEKDGHLDGSSREIEISLKQRYRVSPAIVATMKTLPDILDVEIV